MDVDGSWFQERSQSGLGWILRDFRGKVKWIGAKTIPRLRSALDVEAEAVRWAVLMTWSLG